MTKENMNNSRTKYLTEGAAIGALYVVLTLIANMVGLSSGLIQIRFSEALTVLPYFTPAAVPGLFVGCLVANLITGAQPLDVILGAVATLIGAYGTYVISGRRGGKSEGRRAFDKCDASHDSSSECLGASGDSRFKKSKFRKYLACVPPIISNTLIIPFILVYVYGLKDSLLLCMGFVGIGEIISCGVLGIILLRVLEKRRGVLFSN